MGVGEKEEDEEEKEREGEGEEEEVRGHPERQILGLACRASVDGLFS